MAVQPDNATLIVAESYGQKLTGFDIACDGSLSGRRTWAEGLFSEEIVRHWCAKIGRPTAIWADRPCGRIQ
jgi:hypothetical protein